MKEQDHANTQLPVVFLRYFSDDLVGTVFLKHASQYQATSVT